MAFRVVSNILGGIIIIIMLIMVTMFAYQPVCNSNFLFLHRCFLLLFRGLAEYCSFGPLLGQGKTRWKNICLCKGLSTTKPANHILKSKQKEPLKFIQVIFTTIYIFQICA
jgi:hypothetical protein